MTITDYVPGKLMIGKREYEVKDCELPQAELQFYVDNPRVYSALRSFDGEAPSQQDIERHMCDMDHVKQLRLSIKENGGLIDPVIVREGDFVVLEGNSRLAAYRLLCKTDPVRWGKIKCKVLPADIDDSAIFTLLGQYHIVGRKDWSPYEQAGYLYRRQQESKTPIPSIAKELGITEATAKNYIRVFTYMKEHNDLDPNRWSYYEEFLKNKGITKAITEHPELENTVVRQIQSGEIVAAADIRKIGKIASVKSKKAKKVIEEIAKGEVSVYEGYAAIEETGSFDNVYKKMIDIRDYLLEDGLKDSILQSPKKDDLEYILKKIQKKVKELLDGIN